MKWEQLKCMLYLYKMSKKLINKKGKIITIYKVADFEKLLQERQSCFGRLF